MQSLADVLALSRPQPASAAPSVESASGNSGARNQDGPAVVPVGAAAPVDSANDLGGPAAGVLVRAVSPCGGGRGRQKRWNQARAAGQQRRRWKQSVKKVRAKAKAAAAQASASFVAARHLLAGVVDFTGTEGERARRRWKWNFATVMRAAFAPPALALRQVSEACFGSQVSYSSVHRLKLRVAQSICDLTSSRVAQVMNHVAVGASVNPLCGSTGPALSGGGGAKILVVGQVWKWDSTEVRWRTVDQGGTPAFSTSKPCAARVATFQESGRSHVALSSASGKRGHVVKDRQGPVGELGSPTYHPVPGAGCSCQEPPGGPDVRGRRRLREPEVGGPRGGVLPCQRPSGVRLVPGPPAAHLL